MLDILKVYGTWVKDNIRKDEGQALVEYALILFLISVVSIAVLTTLGGKVKDTLQSVVDAM
jgi:pilus assembly protein Flp/PilA